jgi:surface polysaccharide O-acyltransferase-like enzyme
MEKKRFDFADNIRTLLICQVVMVHASVTYGGEGGWYFSENSTSEVSSILLTLFNAVSQSFFMSLLFLIAGFFTQRSLSKQPSGKYTIGRLKRLGIPLLFFYFVLGPLTIWQSIRLDQLPSIPYLHAVHSGPMWFAQALLMFTAAFMVVRLITGRKPNSMPADVSFSWLPIVLFALVLWFTTIPARAIWPMGHGIAGMQLGSFAQYGFMYALGIAVNRIDWRGWIVTVPLGKVSLVACIGIFILPLGLLLGVSDTLGFAPFMGGLGWQAIFYAGWESVMCVVLSICVVCFIYSRELKPHALWRMMGRSNYGVYLIHPPVMLMISALLLPLDIASVFKFALASVGTIALSFPVAWGLTRLPVIRDIL